MPTEKTTFRVKKEEVPMCDMVNPKVEPYDVKPGERAALNFEVCNKGSGVLATNVNITFSGPTKLPPLRQPVRVGVGSCEKYSTPLMIPKNIIEGVYTVVLNCLGTERRVAMRK